MSWADLGSQVGRKLGGFEPKDAVPVPQRRPASNSALFHSSHPQGDTGRERLEAQALQPEQAAMAALRWRADREAAAVEAVGAWMPPAGAAPDAADPVQTDSDSEDDETSESDMDVDAAARGGAHEAGAFGADVASDDARLVKQSTALG